jgi:hypothetical protein
MSIDVIVAVVGAGAALIGTMVGGVVSIFATKAQLKSASRQIEVDQLRRIESSLESLLQKWTSMKVDVIGPVNTDQILSRFTDMFLSRVGLFMTAAHHFPQDLEEELNSLSNELNGYIFAAKTGGSVDNGSAQEAVRKMQKLDAEVPQRIREKLRRIQTEISDLLQNK